MKNKDFIYIIKNGSLDRNNIFSITNNNNIKLLKEINKLVYKYKIKKTKS